MICQDHRVRSLAGVLTLFGCLSAAILMSSNLAYAAQRVLVIVNDKPITDYDVTQRIRLNEILGYAHGSKAAQRKEALQDIIDGYVRENELKKRKITVSDKEINDWINGMAEKSGGVENLKAKLKKQGVRYSTLTNQVKGAITMRYLMQAKDVDVEVDEKAVDKRYAKISSDPRLKPITVFRVREIELPVDSTSEAMQQQLLYARAVEAQQIMQRYKGCDSAKSAASGIYNVKVSKILEAPADRLPAEMKKALQKAGTRKLVGPARSRNGLQLVAFCGTRTIAPPKPPREAVKNMLMNERYREVTDNLMRDLRRRAFIEYKDPSARP